MLWHVSAALLLRAGLGFTFAYAAWGSFTAPQNWIGFFPQFILSLGIPEALLLGGFSVVEIAVALWLFSGWKVFWPALVSFAMLSGITLFNLGAMDILFRDVGLLFAALALVQLSSR